jgi:hypothetical protein
MPLHEVVKEQNRGMSLQTMSFNRRKGVVSAVELNEARDQLLRTGDELSRSIWDHVLAARDSLRELHRLAIQGWESHHRVDSISAEAKGVMEDVQLINRAWEWNTDLEHSTQETQEAEEFATAN